jgi:hypothetical protein
VSRILDWFVAPVIVDIKPGNDPRPFRSSCPADQCGWTAPRWTSSARTAREQQTAHYVKAHFRYDADSWGGGWSDGFYY